MSPRARAAASAGVVATTLLGACAERPGAGVRAGAPATVRHLFSAATVIPDEWRHVRLVRATEYRIVSHADRLAIRASGRESASGLLRDVELDTATCPMIEWHWSVARLQRGADIRRRDKEDVAAAVLVLFGDPGLPFDPSPVPTLRYVWTNDRVAAESVVDSPYLPGVVRSIVVESGADRLGDWITVRRDLDADFRRAFGRAPPDAVGAIGLFTDNDQTGEPVEAYYAWGRALCGG